MIGQTERSKQAHLLQGLPVRGTWFSRVHESCHSQQYVNDKQWQGVSTEQDKQDRLLSAMLPQVTTSWGSCVFPFLNVAVFAFDLYNCWNSKWAVTILSLRQSRACICVCVCVFMLGATATRDYIISVLGARQRWQRWRHHNYGLHFSCGQSSKDQPGAREAPSEWRRWRHAISLFRHFICHWNHRERIHDLTRIRKWLLRWWNTITSET